MYQVTAQCGGRSVARTYEAGTQWAEIAEDFQQYYPLDILLVQDVEENRLLELHKRLTHDTKAVFLTLSDTAGRMTYARSAIFILLKSIYKVLPRERLERVTVEFTIGGNFYIVPKGSFTLDEALLEKIREKMHAYIAEDHPIVKHNVATADAVRQFAASGMEDKAKLFRYRRVSRVNLYRIGGFEDYFYGAMCKSTGYVKLFELCLYGNGFMLMLPTQKEPDRLPEFRPSEKLFSVQNESFRWAERIGVENIADLNEAICRGEANELILMQEAFFEKKIGEIAQHIAKTGKKIILLAGPSSSGKTSTAHRLALQLRACGIRPHPISADNYFKDFEDREFDENGQPDFESIRAVDTELFQQDMLALLSGREVLLPRYNFVTGKREYQKKTLQLGADDVLIIEGIHCLNEAFSDQLPKEAKYKIYVSALTQLNIDEHNRIPTTDCRLLRRMVRDNRTRGYGAAETIARWPSVRAGEESNIFPYQNEADVIFNTAMIYELAVIKQYAEPLLFSISREAPEYLEAKRLLKFLDYVLSVSPEIIPKTSIVREFIGGSCLDVG